MPKGSYLFTSESVSEGHPDKVCDRISDTIVDTFLTADPYARVAVRDAGHHQPGRAGRRSPRPRVASRRALIEQVVAPRRSRTSATSRTASTGRRREVEMLHPQPVRRHRPGRRCRRQQGRGRRRPGHHVRLCLPRDRAPDAGADLLRPPHPEARLAEARHSGAEPGLGPDAKSQVTLLYENGKPVRATSIVVSTQHGDDLDQDDGARDRPAPRGERPAEGLDVPGARVLRQPDRPLRHRRPGRRCRPDRPQDHRRHLRRRGARMAAAPSPARTRPRSTARPPMPRAIWRRTWSAAGLADRCTIQLSYAIGVSKPLSVYVDTHGTGKVDEEKLVEGAAAS